MSLQIQLSGMELVYAMATVSQFYIREDVQPDPTPCVTCIVKLFIIWREIYSIWCECGIAVMYNPYYTSAGTFFTSCHCRYVFGSAKSFGIKKVHTNLANHQNC